MGARRGDHTGEAGFVHHVHPGYGDDDDGGGAFNLLHFLVFQKGVKWKGDVLGFKVDGDSEMPVHGTATLEVTAVTPPFPDVRFGLVIDWSSGRANSRGIQV